MNAGPDSSFIDYITPFSIRARENSSVLALTKSCKLNDIGIVRLHQRHLCNEFDLKFISRDLYKLKPLSSIHLK